MDLVSAVTNLQAAKTTASVQIAVAKKILDSQKLSGEGALKLLEAATGNVSQAGDELAAQATGLGGNLDIYG